MEEVQEKLNFQEISQLQRGEMVFLHRQNVVYEVIVPYIKNNHNGGDMVVWNPDAGCHIISLFDNVYRAQGYTKLNGKFAAFDKVKVRNQFDGEICEAEYSAEKGVRYWVTYEESPEKEIRELIFENELEPIRAGGCDKYCWIVRDKKEK